MFFFFLSIFEKASMCLSLCVCPFFKGLSKLFNFFVFVYPFLTFSVSKTQTFQCWKGYMHFSTLIETHTLHFLCC
jgi:hypothetical protein